MDSGSLQYSTNNKGMRKGDKLPNSSVNKDKLKVILKELKRL